MRKGAVGALLAVALVLPGCSAQVNNDYYPGETAIALQTQVLEITAAAASGDPALAMVKLNELAALANDALVRGQISEARRDSILSAILLVKMDLETAIQAAELRAEEASRAAEEASRQPVVDDAGENGSRDTGDDADAGSSLNGGSDDEPEDATGVGTGGVSGGDSSDAGGDGINSGDGGSDEKGGDDKGKGKGKKSNSAFGENNRGNGKKLGLGD